jgi:hypothetical protein
MFMKFILILLFLVSVCSLNAQFAGGAGTAANPYQISTRQHMELLAAAVNTDSAAG